MRQIVILALLVFSALAGFSQYQQINNGETGLQVRTKMNDMHNELYDLNLTAQFSFDGVTWHDGRLVGDKYIRFSTDLGSTFTDAVYLFNGVDLEDSLQMNNRRISGLADPVYDQDAINKNYFEAETDTVAFADSAQVAKEIAWPQDSLNLSGDIPDVSQNTTAYTIKADSLTKLFSYVDGYGLGNTYINATQSVPFVNTTTETVLKGTPLSSALLDFSTGRGLPAVDVTTCVDLDLAQTFLGLARFDVPVGEVGVIQKFNFLNDVNTSMWSLGDILYVDCDSTLTNEVPPPPNYKIIACRVAVVDPVNGVLEVFAQSFTGSDTDINIQGYLNGIVTQKPAIRDTIISNVLYFETYNLEDPTIDLPYIYDKTHYDLNTLTNTGTNGYAQVALTYGTANNAQPNYVYIDHNGGSPQLAVSTSGFPDDGLDVIQLNVYDQATHDAYGFGSVQRINNAVDGTNAQGWMYRAGRRIRKDGSVYDSGVEPTFNIVADAGLDSLRLSFASGTAYQFNRNNVTASDGYKILWLNDPINGESWINDLSDIAVDALGNSLRGQNTRYGLNTFVIINSNGYDEVLAVATPNGSYSVDQNAIEDASNLAVTNVPEKYAQTAIRLARVVVNYSTGSGGTFTNLLGAGEYQDERGFVLGSGGSGGGGGGGASTFQGLTDTPNSYTGQGDKILRVANAETGIEYSGATLDPSDNLSGVNDLGVGGDLNVNDIFKIYNNPDSFLVLNDFLTIREGGNIGSGRQYLFMDVDTWSVNNGGANINDANNFHYYDTGLARVEFETDEEMQFYIEGGTSFDAWYGIQEGATTHWSFGSDASDAASLKFYTGFGLGGGTNVFELQKGGDIYQRNGNFNITNGGLSQNGGETLLAETAVTGLHRDIASHRTFISQNNDDYVAQFAGTNAGGVGSGLILTNQESPSDGRHWVIQHRGLSDNNLFKIGYYNSTADGENIIGGASNYFQIDPITGDVNAPVSFSSIKGVFDSGTASAQALSASNNKDGYATVIVENSHASGLGMITKADGAYISDFRTTDNTSIFRIAPTLVTSTVPISASSFVNSTSDDTYVLLGGGGTTLLSGIGTTDHSALSNLDYASSGHTGFEQAFSKNTAFNKDFGTIAGTVAQGNDSRFHEHEYQDSFTGLINSSNTTYTTSTNFTSNTTQVYLNGLRMKRGTDYTESGSNQIVFTTAPTTGDTIVIDFEK